MVLIEDPQHPRSRKTSDNINIYIFNEILFIYWQFNFFFENFNQIFEKSPEFVCRPCSDRFWRVQSNILVELRTFRYLIGNASKFEGIIARTSSWWIWEINLIYRKTSAPDKQSGEHWVPGNLNFRQQGGTGSLYKS